MNNNLTEMVFILDCSGSMQGMESDVIGGFNSLIEKQKQLEGDAVVSTVLFSNDSTVIHDRLPIADVPAMTHRDYTACGSTALLDAIGGAVKHIQTVHRYIRKEDLPRQTIVAINTDGMENSSRSYSYEKVKKMIVRRQEDLGWQFIFMGVDMDAFATGASLGIRPETTVRKERTRGVMYRINDEMDMMISSMRAKK